MKIIFHFFFFAVIDWVSFVRIFFLFAYLKKNNLLNSKWSNFLNTGLTASCFCFHFDIQSLQEQLKFAMVQVLEFVSVSGKISMWKYAVNGWDTSHFLVLLFVGRWKNKAAVNNIINNRFYCPYLNEWFGRVNAVVARTRSIIMFVEA